LDVNKAPYHLLIRVPGIGRISAQRILKVRRNHRVNSLAELRKIGVGVRRAAPFIYLRERQASLLEV
jgi:predicted DNA-binding helix-hairpin-helix protein